LRRGLCGHAIPTKPQKPHSKKMTSQDLSLSHRVDCQARRRAGYFLHRGFTVLLLMRLCVTVLDQARHFGIQRGAMPARVLIVDDHEIVRKGVRMLFANYDSFEVCGEAQNGMEAIRMVPELSPDVVILDLSMPGMNGFETAAKIRLIAPSIRIVFFSTHEIASTALWVGADAFVSKSSAMQDLVLTVNRVLQLGENLQAQQKSSSAHVGG